MLEGTTICEELAKRVCGALDETLYIPTLAFVPEYPPMYAVTFFNCPSYKQVKIAPSTAFPTLPSKLPPTMLLPKVKFPVGESVDKGTESLVE